MESWHNPGNRKQQSQTVADGLPIDAVLALPVTEYLLSRSGWYQLEVDTINGPHCVGKRCYRIEAALCLGYGYPRLRGETRYNKERLLQGQGIDEPLSETGFRQADAAGRFLSNVKFTHVFSSDLIRAKQTAATIVGENRVCKDIKINYDTRLRERKYGVAEGKPLSELKTRAKAAGQQCPKYTPPGGETLEEVRARAKDFFEFLCQLTIEEKCQREEAGLETINGFESAAMSSFPSANHYNGSDLHSDSDSIDVMLDANILLVSHGAYMRNWIKYFLEDLQCTLPSTVKKSRELSVSPNTGISHFVVNLERGETIKPQISCICINRHDHLSELTAEACI